MSIVIFENDNFLSQNFFIEKKSSEFGPERGRIWKSLEFPTHSTLLETWATLKVSRILTHQNPNIWSLIKLIVIFTNDEKKSRTWLENKKHNCALKFKK